MGRDSRKRRTPLATKVMAGTAALALGGGGLIWADVHASADEKGGGASRTRAAGAQVATVRCPDVGQRLRDVPRGARAGVDRELARLDQQITEAYARLASTRQAQAGDAGFVRDSILGPLKSRRTAALDRIGANIRRAGGQSPRGLDRFAGCEGMGTDQPADGDGGQDGGGGGGGGGAAGPVAADFVDITSVEPNGFQGPNGLPADGDTGSTGTFTTECGTNGNDLHNSDNLIVAPGVDNGAHHTHDYVGNQDNDAFSSDDDLAAADTSCRNQGDRSTYYWPVLRLQDGTDEFDAGAPGGGAEGNVGTILQAGQAEIRFVGNRRGDVVAMPKFLRIITGDAKAFTGGLANASTAWSCTGFEDRQLTDRYPLCPDDSQVVRTANFQSCWDGRNTDSANHRDHVAFVGADGGCPNGFRAIPQLQVRLVYDVPAPLVKKGRVRAPYAVDGFPEQLHKPITDHNDFINVMDEELMDEVVRCVNSGTDCQ